jgi:type II pantothenate kinase
VMGGEGTRAQIAAWAPARVAVTGGGATRLAPVLTGVPVHTVGEFEAWAAGAGLAAAAEGVTLPARHLLASLGTGTSVLQLGDGPVRRAGGTALGGGTVLGLGRLLLGETDFAAIAALAAAGDRRRVDLLVGDVYQDAASPLLRDLTAASFAKPNPAPRREDLAHAIMGLVGENVALVCGGLARGAGIETIVFGGSTLDGNPALASIVAGITTLFGHRAVLLRDGAFCGALGAAALAAEAA